MKINIETKYNIGDRLWTGGFEIDDPTDTYIPVEVEVFTIEINYHRATMPYAGVFYGVMDVPEKRLVETLKMSGDRGYNETTDYPYMVNEDNLFRTKEEAELYVKNILPF